jgi:hypothetical protein
MAAPCPSRPRQFARTQPALTTLGISETVAAYLPDARQPLWRRLLFVTLVTATLCLILPNPVVVSDPSHTLIGFEVFPGRTAQFRAAENTPGVWIVEDSPTHELYSNGLRIDTTFALRTQQRFFQALDKANDFAAGSEWLSQPVGIVFHTTESPLAPFEAGQNDNLRRIGRALLKHVVTNQAYNYLVDRFGRVYRIVDELDAANHAGNSIWMHGRSVYLNLNNSFLAVSFESAGDAPLTASQVFAGRMLTQFLRNKYTIPMENCVTHAQVSVNPSNMRIGYHTDGARSFPFLDMGLPNNYDLPVASVAEFGFTNDELFQQALGPAPWKGLALAERTLEQRAANSRRTVEETRAALQERYRQLFSAYKLTGAVDEPAR